MYNTYKKLKERKEKYDYHCIMIKINNNLHEKDHRMTGYYNTQYQIKPEDVYFKKNPTERDKINGITTYNDDYGFDQCPHITVLYGLKKEADYFDLKRLFEKIKKPKIKITEVSSFRNDGKKPYDVLKYTVESKDLVNIHYKIRDKFDCDISFPEYKPHMTIAYVKPGCCINLEGLSLNLELEPMSAVFSHADGFELPLKFKN